jgi:hypothetical protein
LAEALRLKAWSTWWLGSIDEAIMLARNAIRAADKADDEYERISSRRSFLIFAADTPAPDLLEHLACALNLPVGTDGDWLSFLVADILAATAQAGLWPGLRDLILSNRERFENAKSSGAFWKVGKIWADQASERDRAAVFADIARDLPVIRELMAMLPGPLKQDASQRQLQHLGDLLDGLTAACQDPGLLGDIADLVPQVFGPESSEGAERLRTFAAYHAAPDRAAFLQRCDPDLATAIRRIWGRDDLAKPGAGAEARRR